ncbi:alcohol dehydrogenase catalytic domain-containing protein [Luteitalea sp.]|uniref:alcohol dehydrogenase catalytic domain-containing protein n=1 Tax=Luteitalea sp. TaxID=2004800 RepID=UPI0037C73531
MSAARVAIFDGPGRPFQLVDRPLPEQLEPGTVLVAIAMATICGSDIHTQAGRRREPTPSVLGHEGVGCVLAAGEGRGGWVGRRITWTSTDGCGACPACRDWDLPQKCAHVFKYGHARAEESHGLSGTLATHILLREGTHLVEVPAHVPDAVAASANCSLATMAHAVEQRPSPCRTALVLGAGLLGLHGCALLRRIGVERVLMTDTDPSRLAQVAAFEGEAVVAADVPPHTVDLVIDTTGDPRVMGEVLRVLRPGGTCTLVGSVHPQPALALTGEALVRGCVTLRGVHNYAPRHLVAAVEYLQASSLPWDTIVSPPLPLEGIDDAFVLAGTRRWARVAVCPSS